MPLNDTQHEWLVKTLRINVKHAEVETDTGNDLGFKPRARGAEYEGEESELGAWRATKKRDNETDAQYEARIKASFQVTRQYSEAEREANTLSTDESGTLRAQDGTAPTGINQLYAMDPKTGDMVISDGEHYVKRALDAEGNPVGNRLPKGGSFEQDKRDAIASKGARRVEVMHHSTPLSGADVAAAGYVNTKDGKVTKITNASGHYKPQFVHLLQAVEHLMKTGAMLDTEIVDHEQKSVQENHPKAFAVYTKVQTLIKGLEADKKSIDAALTSLDAGEPDEAEAAAMDKKIKTHRARTETAERAIAALRKMGIGPKNEMTGTVEFRYAGGDVTGHEFRTAEAENMQAHELLMGEGAVNPVALEDEDDTDADLISYTTTDGYPADDGTSYPDQGSSDAQFYTSAEVPPPDGLYETVDPAAMNDPAPEPAKPWRNFDAKEEMLDEFKELARDRNLRPEDQGESGKAMISEGRAPALDEDAWNREIDDLADALAEIEAEMIPPAREAAGYDGNVPDSEDGEHDRR